MNKEDVIKQLAALSAAWPANGYNLPEIFLAPLYLELIAHNTSPLKSPGVLRGIRQKAYSLKLFLSGVVARTKIPQRKVQVILHAATLAHITQLEPLAKELKKNHVTCCWVVTKRKLAVELTRLKEDYIFSDGYFAVDLSLSSGFLRKVFALLNKITIDSALNEFFRNFFARNVHEAVSLIRLFEAVITNLKPSLLITGNDLTVEGRVATLVFRKHQRYATAVQHGEVSGLLDARHVVDEFFVYGAVAKASLEKINCFTTFTVTGAPYLDHRTLTTGIHPLLSKTLGIESPYLFVAFSGPGNNTSYAHHRLQINAIYTLALRYPIYTIVVKLHPKDRIEHYQSPQNLNALKNVKIIKHYEQGLPHSIFDWLTGALLVVTGASTTAIEAMQLEIPVIALDFVNEYETIEFIAKRTVVITRTEGQFLETVDVFLKNPEPYRQTVEAGLSYAHQYFHKDEKFTAAQLITDRILSKLQ